MVEVGGGGGFHFRFIRWGVVVDFWFPTIFLELILGFRFW